MSYFPIIEFIEKTVKDFIKWFFTSVLFGTKELRAETERYFLTGQTTFRYFEWLKPAKVRTVYPKRWKIVIIDFFGAYLKLFLSGAVLVAACFALAVLLTSY